MCFSMKLQLCPFIYIDTSKLIFRTRNYSFANVKWGLNDKKMYYLYISAFCNNILLCNYYVLSLILFLFEVNKQQSLVLLNDKTTLTALQKFFREKNRSQGYVTYIAFTSKRKFCDVAWPHDHERILNYQYYEKSSMPL